MVSTTAYTRNTAYASGYNEKQRLGRNQGTSRLQGSVDTRLEGGRSADTEDAKNEAGGPGL